MIESALSRPRQRWSFDPSADLASLAAAYGLGLSRNHGYVDGNRRIALMSIYVFLVLNGREAGREASVREHPSFVPVATDDHWDTREAA